MFRLAIVVVVLFAGVYSQKTLSSSFNYDGTSNVAAKIPITNFNDNTLSAIASKSSTGAMTKGLALDNTNGNSLSLSQTNIPNFGSQLTGAGRLNLLHNDNHQIDANAFITRNAPNIPQVPGFNTVGGGLDYMFKNKIGASLSAANTPFLHRTDYSALGKLNLFHSPTTSLDLSAGFGKSVAPNFNTNWQPQGTLTFSKFFL